MAFLRDVLAGKKKYMHIHDVTPYDVPKFKDISVKNVFDKIKDSKLVMSYLPDFDPEELDPKYALDREWFFNILNTLDGEFFPRIVDGIEEQRAAALAKGKPDEYTVEICEDLVDLIEYGIGKRTAGAARSMASLRKCTKPRKRMPSKRRTY